MNRPASGRRPPHVLHVHLGSTCVGMLTNLGNDSVIFTFDPEYIENAGNRPTLSLGYKAASGNLVEQTRPTRARLSPFFSNLLPEGHLREYLARRGGIHTDREFLLVWLLGADLPGAIEIRAADDSSPPSTEHVPTGREGDDRPLRFSLAGVQLKFSALMEASKGLTLPVEGVGGDWIVKLPSPRFDAVPENEFAMMTFARAVGIDVPDVRLVDTNAIANLPHDLPEAFGRSVAVRRFDRPTPGERRHTEDFAQVFGLYPEEKYRKASYANIAGVLWRESGEAAVVEFTKRLVFNVLIGNADAHVKNWSVLYPDRRTAALAPAYDLVSTIAYIPNDRLALSLGGTKVFAEVEIEHFRHLAEKARLPVRIVLRTVRETAEAVRDLWPGHEPGRALPDRLQDAVNGHMNAMKL